MAKVHRKGWLLLLGLLALFFLLPYLPLLSGIFGSSESWDHLAATVLGRYLRSSLILVLASCTGALMLGTALAWVMSRYDFPGKGLLEVGLILPHAMPVYIAAFAYRGLFDFGGLLDGLVGDFTGIPAAVFLFVFGLYTYVYLAARAQLTAFGAHHLDAARTLGASPTRQFFRVALPLMRPAAFAGAVLTGVEVLNEYGALKYLGVESLTTGIFRAWFALGDVTAAFRLALFLLLFIGLLTAAERLQRGRRSFNSDRGAPLTAERLSRWKGRMTAALVTVPVLLGFLLPALQLLLWTGREAVLRHGEELLVITLRTLALSVSATAAAVLLAVLLGFIPLLFRRRWVEIAASLPSLGYSVPGAVIAIGVTRVTTAADFALNDLLNPHLGGSLGLLVSGSAAVLAAAYLIRFFAVAYHPIGSAYTALGAAHLDSAAVLGKGPAASLRLVYAPRLGRAALFAGVLFFLDAVKELPLTLILRPFDFDTLATITFALASDERLAEAAPYGLILVTLGAAVTALFVLATRAAKAPRTPRTARAPRNPRTQGGTA